MIAQSDREAIAMGAPMEAANHAPLDAFVGAAAYLRREWGDYGYRIGYVGQYGIPGKPYLFEGVCSDGSRFHIVTDRYGDAAQDRRGEA